MHMANFSLFLEPDLIDAVSPVSIYLISTVFSMHILYFKSLISLTLSPLCSQTLSAFFGSPIHCATQASFRDTPGAVVQSFCWMKGVFTLLELPDDESSGKRRSIPNNYMHPGTALS